jgi:hypothetical protein
VTSFVDSKQRELSQEEIIEIAARETGGKYTAEQVKASLTAEAYELGALMLRQGNTIFVVHQDKSNPTVALFRALNADVLPNYLQNCIEFTKAVGMMGFKYLITQFHDESLLKIFEYVRRHQPFKDMGYEVNKTVDGGYQVTVNLGDTPRTMAIQEQKKFVAEQGKK